MKVFWPLVCNQLRLEAGVDPITPDDCNGSICDGQVPPTHFGQKRSTAVISDWGRSQITSTQSGHWLVITRKKMNFGAPDDDSSFTQFGFTFFAISHLSRAPVSAMVNVTTR